MQAVKRSVIKFKDGRQVEFHLMRVEEKCFRWMGTTAHPSGGIDFLTEADAMKHVRVTVEGEPAFVGADLTIFSMEPTPAERAAGIIGFEFGMTDTRRVAEIIEQETNLSALLEAGEVLLAYLLTRRLWKDMALGGLMLAYIEQVEKTKQCDLANLKKIIASPGDRIMVTGHLPKGPGGPVQ